MLSEGEVVGLSWSLDRELILLWWKGIAAGGSRATGDILSAGRMLDDLLIFSGTKRVLWSISSARYSDGRMVGRPHWETDAASDE